MRRMGMAAVGVFGVIAGLVALGFGIVQAFGAMSVIDGGGSLAAALPLVLLGGAAMGGVLVAGRVSRAAPLSGGVLLLAVAVLGTVFPYNMYVFGGVGMGAVIAGPLATVLLAGAVVVRRSPSPAAVGFPTGHGPYPPGPRPYPPGMPPPGPGAFPAGPPYAPGPGDRPPLGATPPGATPPGATPPGAMPPAGRRPV